MAKAIDLQPGQVVSIKLPQGRWLRWTLGHSIDDAMVVKVEPAEALWVGHDCLLLDLEVDGKRRRLEIWDDVEVTIHQPGPMPTLPTPRSAT